MYLVCLRAARCLRSGHHHQLTTIIIKYFPFRRAEMSGDCVRKAWKLFAKPNHIFDQGVWSKINQSVSLAVHSMQIGVYIYFENIMNVGCSVLLLRICQDITRKGQQKPTGAQRTQRGLATFSWRRKRPAAQCWQTSWGPTGNPCSWWTPCKTALLEWSCRVYSQCSAVAAVRFCLYIGRKASRAWDHSPCTRTGHRYCRSLLFCS